MAENDAKSLNPHIWIPHHGPEPYDEVCALCGVFSGAHNKRPAPPAAILACPEPWPEVPALTQEEMDEIERITDDAGGGPILIQLPPRDEAADAIGLFDNAS